MKSAGNAVIPMFPTRWSHGLQHLRYKRRNVRFEGLRRVHTCLRQQDRTQRHARRNRGLPDGAAITTLGAFRTFTNIPGPGVRTAYFAALGSWPRVLPKNAESLRNSDALMRVTVPRRRGPAGLRNPFFVSVEIAVCTSCAQGLSARAKEGVVSLPSACSVCCRNAGRPLVKKANLPFSGVAEHHSLLGPFFANI